jgi:hypothetical protein
VQDWLKGLVATFIDEGIQRWPHDMTGALIDVVTVWSSSLMQIPTCCSRYFFLNCLNASDTQPVLTFWTCYVGFDFDQARC